MKKISIPQRGSVMVTMLFMLSILALMVAAVVSDSSHTLRSVSQSGRDTQAKYAAYAGLEYALNRLRQDPDFIGEEVRERHGRYVADMDGLENFRFDVKIWNNIQEDGTDTEDAPDLAGPDGVVVRPDTVYLVSSGWNVERGEEVILSSMAGTARRIRPVFDDAAYARTKMAFTGSGSLVDAWDSSSSGAYQGGSFPGDSGGSGGGGGGGGGESGSGGSSGGGGGDGDSWSNVQNHKATLGTDTAAGRTLRLLAGARLNGHYRVGPDVNEERAFGPDAGTSSVSIGSDDDISAETSYSVTTAQNEEQVAGVEPREGEDGPTDKVVIDSKNTEVPFFVAPYSADDCIPGPTLNNPSVAVVDRDGEPVLDDRGDPIINPPEPVTLAPGGYTDITVPRGQTLQLGAGVYFFRDELNVDGGSVIIRGDGPSIVFCGKKAIFRNAEVNPDRNTSQLQLCFTDDLKNDEETLESVVSRVEDIFAGEEAGDETLWKNRIAPTTTDGDREGFSVLETYGNSKIHGSISGRALVADMRGGELFGSIMANVIRGENAQIHQDLALKGSNLMAAGGWALESVHQIR